MIANFISYLSDRFSIVSIALPSLSHWAIAALLLGLYTVIALPLGFYTQFLQHQWVSNRKIQLQLMVTAIATPALVEELVFRVLLLPSPHNSPTITEWLLWGSLSLILFILYHPLNGLLFFPPGREVFQTPIFLALAALLGLICTLSYGYSGSLWIPVAIHWIVVVVWLLALGGYEKLGSVASRPFSLSRRQSSNL